MRKQYHDELNDLYERLYGHSYDRHRELLRLPPVTIEGEPMPKPKVKRETSHPRPPEPTIDWGEIPDRIPPLTIRATRTHVFGIPMQMAPPCKLPNDPTPKGDFEMDA